MKKYNVRICELGVEIISRIVEAASFQVREGCLIFYNSKQDPVASFTEWLSVEPVKETK